MKKLIFVFIFLISAAALYAELLAPAASGETAGAPPALLPAGKALKLTCQDTCKGELTYKRSSGKHGSHKLYFKNTGYYIPYDNISELQLPDGVSAEVLKADNIFVYNGQIYDKFAIIKETAKPDKVFKTAGDTLGLGILKNGSLTMNIEFKRQYFAGQSGFICQTENGLYKLDKVTISDNNIVFACPEINTQVTAVFEPSKNHIKIHCTAAPVDSSRPSKAATCAMHIAFGAGIDSKWLWQHSLNEATLADGQLQELQERPLDAPYFYPIGFLHNTESACGIAMLLDPSIKNPPANISYSGTLGSMYTIFELTDGQGEFCIDISKHTSEWGMREPYKYYSELYKDCFTGTGAPVTSDKIQWNSNKDYASASVKNSLTDTELLFVRAMAGSRKVYMDLDMPLSETKNASARGIGFGFIPKHEKTEIGKVKEYRELAEKLFALPWQPVPEASANNPAITTERFGDKGADKYYIVCKNTTALQQPAIIRIFSLPTADIKIKELIRGTEPTVHLQDIRTVFSPNELLIYEIENRWN